MGEQNTTIPWQEYVETHNRIHGSNFKTPQEMLTSLYAREQTLEKVSKILGVSHDAINRHMRRWGLPRLPRGHRGTSPLQVAYLKIKNPEQYTHEKLAEMLGCSTGYVTNLKRNCKQKERQNGKQSETISRRC